MRSGEDSFVVVGNRLECCGSLGQCLTLTGDHGHRGRNAMVPLPCRSLIYARPLVYWMDGIIDIYARAGEYLPTNHDRGPSAVFMKAVFGTTINPVEE